MYGPLLRTLLAVSAMAALCLSTGCDRGSTEPATEAEEPTEESAEPAAGTELQQSVRAAAAIRTAAHTDPSSLPRVMQEHNVTAAELEQMLYRIAADREAALEYERLTGENPR